MKKAIVTTTINPPTAALLKFIEIGARDDWSLFIVGDQKTPHDEYLKLAQQYGHVAYIHPQKQEEKYFNLSELIGWNCIQRRNIGFLEALAWGADVIATVDDDNIPYDSWGQMLAFADEPLVGVHKTIEPIFDPLSVTDHSDLWHRGFPLQLLRGRRRSAVPQEVRRFSILVQADFWNGEPDVDAVCRIAKGPFECHFSHRGFFASDKPGPFNSQNTFIHRDAFPHYFLFPHIGRMDDIWASYVLQSKFPGSVIYGPATVYQERNVHDLTKDLEAEALGYKHTLDLCQALFDPTAVKGAWLQYFPQRSLSAYEEFKVAVFGILNAKEPNDVAERD